MALALGETQKLGVRPLKKALDELYEVLRGADMVFITCGMGGGTGTGAAPILAQVSRELGALTIGVVTKPFTFEGKRRQDAADAVLRILRIRLIR